MDLKRFIRPGFAASLCGLAALAVDPANAAQRPAQGSTCAPYSKAITLGFKTLAPAPVYNNRLSIQGIRNLFREHTDAVLGDHARALGITYAETHYEANARSSATTMRGGFCVYLASVDIDFGWRRMEVYVASEFAPGSCEYRSVLDHENQHVAANNGSLREFAPRFRAEVEKILRAQQPVFTRDAQAGMDVALASVEQGMSASLAQFQKLMAERNAPLDSSSNYDATAKLCANWKGTAPAPKPPAPNQ